ncbi:helix-turn-helix transcriptional regulator [Streptomyces sp. NRRL F-5123]|uniref:helix-turn-helix transcriptional regulator n=1 Tax=Streptomyces sp. NRRL F-5123 TaxID=1463856 RepID=UPI0004E26854|nr:LuxR C-terminal-related transcriptional regulator [Streptomyces sp. NRRL F-5123]
MEPDVWSEARFGGEGAAGAVFRLDVGGQAERLVVEQYPRATGDEYGSLLGEMAGSVVESADGMLVAGPGQAEVEAAAAMSGRGVRVRAMYPRALLAVPEKASWLRQVSDAGVSVRVLDHLPHDLMVFDRHTVCLAARAAASGAEEPPLVRVSGELLASSFAAIYESYWRRGTPLSRISPGPHHAQLGERERAVIRLMTNGYSDDRIARKLGITTPDVQSVMAALMERLGAGSRFEAGYKLAREVDPRDL